MSQFLLTVLLVCFQLVQSTRHFLRPKSECIPGTGDEAFKMYLPYKGITITVPPVPKSIESFSYATNNAMVAIPPKCHKQFEGRLGPVRDLDDRQPAGPRDS